MCGGTCQFANPIPDYIGLSPRVRGNHNGSYTMNTNVRSIPACAGEPEVRTEPLFTWKVYPRVCGGTPFQHVRLLSRGGLSPRVRGNLNPSAYSIVSTRSIPACAGEPCTDTTTEERNEVYPRVCGGTWCSPSNLLS